MRVWRGDVPVGAGFLAGPAHVLTAAHVVAAALDVREGGPRPDGPVEIDFPLLAPGRRIAARVAAWVPVGDDLSGDIAGLDLLELPPEGGTPLVLSRSGGLTPDQLVMVGFPHRLEIGSWVYGRRAGPVATGWVEVHSEPGREARLEPGFSGTAVWGPELDAAVGMVVRRVTGAPPKLGYMITVDALLAAWPGLADVIEREPPFRALRPFDEQDADLFFGREEQSERVAKLVRTAPVVCVVGPSGVGKSSLLRAGVLPRLADVDVVVLRPSDASTPLRSLATALDRLLHGRADDVERVDALVARLAGGGIADVVAAVLDRSGKDRLVVAVDQFEEVFDLPQADQVAFTAVLRAALRPAARWAVLLNLRDTFLGTALRAPATVQLAGRWLPVTVGELTSSQLRAAITGPLARIGTVECEPGLVDRVVEDVQTASSPLPLVQFTLTELWQRRRRGLLRHETYDELGGVRGALAAYAEDVWTALDPEARRTATRLLVQLIRPLPDGDLTVRRTARREELDADQWAVAQRLAATRLLVLRVAPGPGVELAHESLLSHWARLREVAARYRDFRTWQETLRQRMRRWSDERSAPRRLLSGADLRDANRWSREHRADLSPAEREYVGLSNRRRLRRAARVAVVLVLALVAAVVTQQSVDRQRATLAANDMAAKAAALRIHDSHSGLQMALRAYRTDSDVKINPLPDWSVTEVDRLLPDYTVVASAPNEPDPRGGPPGLRPIPVGDADFAKKVSADGQRLVTTDSARRAVVWDIDGERVTTTRLDHLFGPNDRTNAVTISRSGRYVAFVQMVGFRTLKVTGPTDENGMPALDPAEYPTCAPVNMFMFEACLVVYDVDARRVAVAAKLGATLTSVAEVAIDPDDKVVAVVMPTFPVADLAEMVASENRVRTWDLRTGQPREEHSVPWRGWITDLWFAPGARTATVQEIVGDEGERPRLRLSTVDFSGPTTRVELADHVDSSAVSLDWRVLAATTTTPAGKHAVVWDTETRAETARVTALSEKERDGTVGLDATGDTLLISWREDLDTSITDIRKLPRGFGDRLSSWRLPTGEKQDTASFDTGWSTALLLDDTDGPVLLVSTSAIGVVLPHPNRPPPLRRLTAAVTDQPRLDTDDLVDRLCEVLADPENDQTIEKSYPEDADRGELCPS
ncbi:MULTISPECIES: serine protease [unclassified Saccharothrix]|uniref:serine protease n=1 Tax=unclassified Saccharothrix TaxID=2593673 RepID=UPI00307D0C8E